MNKWIIPAFLAYVIAGTALVWVLNGGRYDRRHLPASLGEADVISEAVDR